MKLLLDQNLSPYLVRRLADIYPESCHVSQVGLDRVLDFELWDYAQTNNYVIVTKDADFGDLATLRGFPPKLIWLRLGNCSTRQIEEALRANHTAICAMVDDPTAGVLILV